MLEDAEEVAGATGHEVGDGSARRRVRITFVIDADLSRRLRDLAIERGAALSRIVEEAVREYLARRPAGTAFELRARLPRAPRRPSRPEILRDQAREAALHRRTGRRLKESAPAGGSQ